MGISLDDAKVLIGLSRKGVSFERTLTLGRQQIFFSPSELRPMLRKTGFSPEAIDRFISRARDTGPAEPFIELLGAKEVISMDYSSYEGASIQHDLNEPVPTSLHDSFDLVLDGGTLEHVFNFPVAIRNAMEMVKVGGSLISVVPANNQLGHGFYQFSPELFYNVLSPANGFQVERMMAIEISPAHRAYLVANPSEVKSRVTLTNAWPVNMFVHARKTAKTTIFARTPQQTDYAATWKASEANQSAPAVPGGSHTPSTKAVLKVLLRKPLARLAYFALTLKKLLNNGFEEKKFFRPI